ncbi:hypothetical protein AXG93_1129s1030 [Marchantia polymorpha subsp. ruderalis]|uniref:Uncharacterized protein n=1 Tax=Marchantia polymorpha subsp. ruderalis TaxID=1480154 RepID=A0A176W2S1_MARPO|nr:hypothetical protein AXG93_1129s1030 [Marchantia polymorpha subsp. ruderalis]
MSGTLYKVKSFCDNKHGGSYPQAEEYSDEALSWFSVENYTWYSCLLYSPELICGLQPKVWYFEIFDRNKEWILMAVSSHLSSGESFDWELRGFKSSWTMEPEMEKEWTLLSSWTMDDIRMSAAAGKKLHIQKPRVASVEAKRCSTCHHGTWPAVRSGVLEGRKSCWGGDKSKVLLGRVRREDVVVMWMNR